MFFIMLPGIYVLESLERLNMFSKTLQIAQIRSYLQNV